jgi:hypothetical protein
MIKRLLLLFLLLPVLAWAGAETKQNNYSYTSTGTTFANLTTSATPQLDGTGVWCSDCCISAICGPGGTGAWATRLAGTWNCGNISNNLTGYLGPVGITGGHTDGSDQISQVNVNGVLNAQTYGAKGDNIFSGDGTRVSGPPDGACTGTVFTSASGAFTTALVGDLVAIDGAGASGGPYIGTVSALVSPTSLTVAPACGTAVTAKSYTVGYDNSSSLQNWINAARNQPLMPTLYLPTGQYLHRGLDFTQVSNLSIYGDGGSVITGGTALGQYGGSSLNCVSPTNANAGAPTVCHDFTGNGFMTIQRMNFKSGLYGGAPAAAGGANVLLARNGTGPGQFSIENKLEDVTFQAWGAYDVVLFNTEQDSFIDDVFNWNADPAKAIYISSINTPGFRSPYRGAINPVVYSETVLNFIGGKQQFSSNGTNAITIDGSVIQLVIHGGFARMNASGDNFIADSGSSSALTQANIQSVNLEPQNANNGFMKLLGSLQESNISNIDTASGVAPTVPFLSAANLNATQVNGILYSAAYPNPEIVYAAGVSNIFNDINNSYISTPATDAGNFANAYSGNLLANGYAINNGGTVSLHPNGAANITPTATFADGTHCGVGGSIGGTTASFNVVMGSTNPTTACPITLGTAPQAQCPGSTTPHCTETPYYTPGNPWQQLIVEPLTAGSLTILAQTDMHAMSIIVNCICG